MKKLLSLYLLLSLAAQPLVAAQATPQSSSITGKTIAAAVGATSLVAAVITYLLLAKSDQQVCNEFHAKVDAALNNGDITPIRYQKTTIRPFFSSEPRHGYRTVTRTTTWKCVINNDWIRSQNGCYRAVAHHDISTWGPLRVHDLRSNPEKNPAHQSMQKFNQEASTLSMVARPKQKPLEKKR